MESVRNKIDQMNLNSSIKLIGFVDHSEIPKWMSKMDVVIIPSVAEPFGLVAIEAINSGTPVVISKGAGICEFIPDLLQVDNWDVFNFGVIADRLLRDEDFKISYTEKCKKTSQTLSWDNSARLVEKLYKTL